MTRLWMVSLMLIGWGGTLTGQVMVEGALAGGISAASSSSARRIGKPVGDIVRSLDRVVKPVAAKAPAQSTVSSTEMPEVIEEAPRAKLAEPVRTYEDPVGIQVGMASDELLRRFGPAQLDMMGPDMGRVLSYRANSGVYQLEVRNNKVNRISIMSRHQTALVLPSHGSEAR